MNKFGNALLFRLILLPLSRLPMRVLYLLADVLWPLVYYVIRYRREVVHNNLSMAFPEESPGVISKWEKIYFRRLFDLIVESVKAFTISEEELKARYKVKKPEVAANIYREGKSMILVGGHLHNWEWLVLGQNLLFDFQAVGVGQPLTSQDFARRMFQARSRFGMWIVDQTNVRESIDQWHQEGVKMSVLMLADQSPNSVDRCYWAWFLGLPTPVIYGPEYFAKKYDLSVVFFSVTRPRRGYYEMELTLISDTPSATEYGFVTAQHTCLLEQAIRHDPTGWTWSHKRWKHMKKAPESFLATKPDAISRQE